MIKLARKEKQHLCPFCHLSLPGYGSLGQCGECKTIHHLICWNEYGHCSVFGCPGTLTLLETRHRLLQRISLVAGFVLLVLIGFGNLKLFGDIVLVLSSASFGYLNLMGYSGAGPEFFVKRVRKLCDRLPWNADPQNIMLWMAIFSFTVAFLGFARLFFDFIEFIFTPDVVY